MKPISITVLGALLAVAGCKPAQAPTNAHETAAPATETAGSVSLSNYATTRQVMLGITTPTSDVLFQIDNEPPADDQAWERIVANAKSLAESANLLKAGNRLVDRQDWLMYSNELIRTSQIAAAAALERNVDKVLEAGNQIYEVCNACHKKYLAAHG